MNRHHRLIADLSCANKIIEVGASHNPIAPKRDGWATVTVDHTDKDGLIRKYNYSAAQSEIIEEVDVIWDSGPLHEKFTRLGYGTFDAIIASHVLEHLPDPISFLRSCNLLLRDGGKVVLALPDHRRCFDFFGSLTTAGDWLENHLRNATTHSVRAAWNDVAYAVQNDNKIGWSAGIIGELSFAHPFDLAKGCALRAHRHTQYFDHHAWRFVPPSFALMMLELQVAGYVNFRVDNLSDVVAHEFFADLIKEESIQIDEKRFATDRMSLLKECVLASLLQIYELGMA